MSAWAALKCVSPVVEGCSVVGPLLSTVSVVFAVSAVSPVGSVGEFSLVQIDHWLHGCLYFTRLRVTSKYVPMFPASKGSPLETSPCLPEMGSCPWVSLFIVVVVAVVLGFSFSLVLLSPQTAFAAALAIEFIASMVADVRLTRWAGSTSDVTMWSCCGVTFGCCGWGGNGVAPNIKSGAVLVVVVGMCVWYDINWILLDKKLRVGMRKGRVVRASICSSYSVQLRLGRREGGRDVFLQPKP